MQNDLCNNGATCNDNGADYTFQCNSGFSGNYGENCKFK